MLQLTAGLRRIELVRAAAFRVGGIVVDPPTRTLRCAGRTEVIEPRVMQTLVALAEADGAVVSRDDLIDRCWDGRIVGDNAINRAISRIRQASAAIAPHPIEIETITKVGYRLAQPSEPIARPDPRPYADPRVAAPRASRRGVLRGGAAAAACAAVAGGLWAWTRRAHRPAPETLELYRRGVAAQRVGTPDQVRQAPAYFEQAVAADPDYADAWGALALAYRHVLDGFAEGETASLPARIDAAADRALRLDPGNADARLARIIVKPTYRNWLTLEGELRTFVRDHPDHWLGLAQLGLVLQDVGRIDEAIPHHERVNAIDPFLPVSHAFLARALSLAGRLQESDTVIEAALRRWPGHPVLWSVRFNSLIFNARPGEALAFTLNPAARPQGLPAAAAEERAALARAMAGSDAAEIDRRVAQLEAESRAHPSTVTSNAPLAAALGRPDAAFAMLEAYFDARGAPGPVVRRLAIPLFSPPLIRLRTDPRHAALLRLTGLEAYYRASGSRPDFRRTG